MIFFTSAKLSSCVWYWGWVGKQIYFVFASRPIMENEKLRDWLTERIFIYPENYDNPHWANGQQHTHTHPPSPLSLPLPSLSTLPEQCLAESMSLYMQIFDIRWGVGEREWERVVWKGGQFRCSGLLLFSTKFIESPPLFLMKSNALRKSGTAAERLKNVQINFMTAFVCYVHIFSVLHTVSRLHHCLLLLATPSFHLPAA